MAESMESRERDAVENAGPGTRTRRRFDPGSVVTGLFFLAVAAAFLVSGLAGRLVGGPEVLVPAVLLGMAAVMVVRVVTRSRRHR
ncbi:hypothetical protein GCM10009678_40320 [Actinomadura kijaniata]|uniref:High-affinity Fe2+/Pb2+ permease n=1 Tax=Actinomadura namibiensis TaxID=182080 RepID=A0A7W3LUH8_ACTNM|nr:hypothetical protein [Actinomadura namibiensis]MBA8954489.1 high-affinity Fe2+/Pb2+ permease [Actinomadura namibiensis]